MIIDGYSDLHNGSNNLDDSDNKSDGHDSLSFLRTLFSPAELGGDFLKTDLGVDIKQDGLYKRFLKNTAAAAEKSKVKNSAGKNLISLNFLSGGFL
jgi:hypothetical protein